MRDFIIRLGKANSVLLTTLISIALSVITSYITVRYYISQGINIDMESSIYISIFIPFVVAPVVSWFVFNLLFEIHELELKMRNFASIDSLTGLTSRRSFMESANQFLSLATREKTSLSLLIIDLDHFKHINDNYGHHIGDAILKLFAEVGKKIVRTSDLFGRIGGEEFAIMLPNTNMLEATEFSARLLNEIRASEYQYNETTIKYTASIGITALDHDEDSISIDDLFKDADTALYTAKRKGRDCIVNFYEMKGL